MTPYDALTAASPGDPYLAHEVDGQQVARAWGGDGASVWLAPSAYHGKMWLTGFGDPAAAGRLAAEVLAGPDGDRAAGISLPPGAVAQLPARLTPDRFEHWTWWWTQHPPRSAPDPAVVALADDDPRLPALLSQSSSVYLRPGDARVRGWFGLVEAGRLLACLAHERHHPDVPHLASVVVDAERRGRGYGGRLCATAVGRLIEGAPAVSLAMMTANTAAAALYGSLGFAPVHAFASGTLPGRRGFPAAAGPRRP